jgi:hypothetical protein
MRWRYGIARPGEKLGYYAANVLRLFVPCAMSRMHLPRLLASLQRHDADEVLARVAYCAGLSDVSALGHDALRVGSFRDDSASWAYYFDLRRTLPYFHPELRFHYVFGDLNEVPARPAFVKSRPIGAGNGNAVLLKLNRIRHFRFVGDRVPFQAKRPRVVWRGNARNANRLRVLQLFHDHPLCDVGHVGWAPVEPAWCKPSLTIPEQMRFRYILSVEGNDVATSLKWSMASQSLCLMVRPRYETWFLEGQLVPGVHYVELADDYSDLEMKVEHHEAHPEEALEIIQNANHHVARFRDSARERLLELLVAARYFERTGQTALLGSA